MYLHFLCLLTANVLDCLVLQRAAERAAAGVEEPVASKSSAATEAVPGPEEIAARERDERLQEMVDQYNAKKRPAPLVDTHLAKKKVGENG